MTSLPKQEPFRVVDAPDRDKVLAWSNVQPSPLAPAEVAEIAFVIYQKLRREKP